MTAWFFSPLRQHAYRIVVVDCPWAWKNYTEICNWRSPEAKYQTMTLGEIASLPVRDLLTKDGFALIWMTWPLIAAQTQIVQNSWGLSIRTGGAWAKRTKNGKLRIGTGFILRSACEPFLIASVGHNGGLRGRSEPNLIDGLARAHSQKPDEVYAMLTRMTPGWRRADIFGCDDRKGWDRWGDNHRALAPGKGPSKGR